MVSPVKTSQYPLRKSHCEENAVLDEVVLYAPDTKMTYSLNRSARAIWELCDGAHTVGDIAQALGKSVGCPPEDLLSDITEAVIKLCELDLIELSPSPSNHSSKCPDAL